jgi:hypothetical protein
LKNKIVVVELRKSVIFKMSRNGLIVITSSSKEEEEEEEMEPMTLSCVTAHHTFNLGQSH